MEFFRLHSCPFCHSSQLTLKIQSLDFETGLGPFQILECGDCHLFITSPQPTEASLPELYAGRDTPDFPNTQGALSRLRAVLLRRRYQKVLSRVQGTNLKLLDFGCGDGFLLNALKEEPQLGSFTGVDFHAEAPPLLQKEQMAYFPTFEFLRSSPESYDVIFCRHVLEHHPRPWEMARALYQKLTPGGILLVEVPNINSIWRRILGKYFFPLYLPRHLFHFTPESFRKIFSEPGFEVSQIHTPVLGRSLGYWWKTNMQNMGLAGCLTFPIQVLVDKLCGRSTVLLGTIQKS